MGLVLPGILVLVPVNPVGVPVPLVVAEDILLAHHTSLVVLLVITGTAVDVWQEAMRALAGRTALPGREVIANLPQAAVVPALIGIMAVVLVAGAVPILAVALQLILQAVLLPAVLPPVPANQAITGCLITAVTVCLMLKEMVLLQGQLPHLQAAVLPPAVPPAVPAHQAIT